MLSFSELLAPTAVACVAEKDLAQAMEQVSTAEQKGFFDFLCLDWRTWQTSLRRNEQQLHTKAVDEFVEAMSDDVNHGLQYRLQAMAAEPTPSVPWGPKCRPRSLAESTATSHATFSPTTGYFNCWGLRNERRHIEEARQERRLLLATRQTAA